ncbi:hypothetical protein FACS1894102_6400 [Spirochaetia bacterium]|nr:hypothetical protein FACS1894102_6400 [Spirochaetia bacterium]
MSDLKNLYKTIKTDIDTRLGEFKKLYEGGSHKDIFKEMCFCTCTPQNNARAAWDAVCVLDSDGVLLSAGASDIAKILRANGVRFHQNKARYIEINRERFYPNTKKIIGDIITSTSNIDARNYLEKNVMGWGLKEASHFLRNIGFGNEISILDRDSDGSPKAHFLIKRAVAAAGDTVVNIRGDMFIKHAGENRMVSETDYNERRGWKHNLTRLVKDDAYPLLVAAGKAEAYTDLRLSIPAELEAIYQDAQGPSDIDFIAMETARLGVLQAAFPHETRFSKEVSRRTLGRYVSADRILPLGDNRDNSHDGRFFGPVKVSKILGRGSFKFWPMARFGTIK